MPRFLASLIITLLSLLTFLVWAPTSAAASESRSCSDDGWQELKITVSGMQRRLLFKTPPGAWENGAILVLHGGGGNAEGFCGTTGRLLVPQTNFTEMAIAQKFAVFALESTDIVSDNEGKVCGKVWDDEVRARNNLDLPYLKSVIQELVAARRPADSNTSVFMVGHSSGGYMSARAASNMGNLITGFAAISSGDPYGWTRRCDPQYGNLRQKVKGAGFDNETGKQIIEVNACAAKSFVNEKPWDQFEGSKPFFRIFHNTFDGINDSSCGDKIDQQLRLHGFPGEPIYLAKEHNNRRRMLFHFWADEYNPEILAFFKRHQWRPVSAGQE